MLYFANWKILLILGVCALGVLFSLPNLFTATQLAWLPSWIPHKQVNLGLDLRGGSYLLLQVDVAAAQTEQLNSTIDNVRDALREAKIGYTGLNVENNAIVFSIRDTDRIEDARGKLAKIDPSLSVAISPDGAGKMQFTPQATDMRRQQAVDQSIEIIRRRLDETGTKEPTIQRQGADRILVELPGVGDPEHVKQLLGKTAKLTFQLVDQSMSPEEAKRGRMPLGSEVLPAQTPKQGQPQLYLLKRRVMVGGDT